MKKELEMWEGERILTQVLRVAEGLEEDSKGGALAFAGLKGLHAFVFGRRSEG